MSALVSTQTSQALGGGPPKLASLCGKTTGVAFLKPQLVGVSSSVLQGILLFIFLPQTFHDLPFPFLLPLMFALLG